jgi:hypothetical protein
MDRAPERVPDWFPAPKAGKCPLEIWRLRTVPDGEVQGQIVPGQFSLGPSATLCYPKFKEPVYAEFRILFSGFATTACRSIFAMVFAQVLLTNLPVRPYLSAERSHWRQTDLNPPDTSKLLAYPVS